MSWYGSFGGWSTLWRGLRPETNELKRSQVMNEIRVETYFPGHGDGLERDDRRHTSNFQKITDLGTERFKFIIGAVEDQTEEVNEEADVLLGEEDDQKSAEEVVNLPDEVGRGAVAPLPHHQLRWLERTFNIVGDRLDAHRRQLSQTREQNDGDAFKQIRQRSSGRRNRFQPVTVSESQCFFKVASGSLPRHLLQSIDNNNNNN